MIVEISANRGRTVIPAEQSLLEESVRALSSAEVMSREGGVVLGLARFIDRLSQIQRADGAIFTIVRGRMGPPTLITTIIAKLERDNRLSGETLREITRANVDFAEATTPLMPSGLMFLSSTNVGVDDCIENYKRGIALRPEEKLLGTVVFRGRTIL